MHRSSYASLLFSAAVISWPQVATGQDAAPAVASTEGSIAGEPFEDARPPRVENNAYRVIAELLKDLFHEDGVSDEHVESLKSLLRELLLSKDKAGGGQEHYNNIPELVRVITREELESLLSDIIGEEEHPNEPLSHEKLNAAIESFYAEKKAELLGRQTIPKTSSLGELEKDKDGNVVFETVTSETIVDSVKQGIRESSAESESLFNLVFGQVEGLTRNAALTFIFSVFWGTVISSMRTFSIFHIWNRTHIHRRFFKLTVGIATLNVAPLFLFILLYWTDWFVPKGAPGMPMHTILLCCGVSSLAVFSLVFFLPLILQIRVPIIRHRLGDVLYKEWVADRKDIETFTAECREYAPEVAGLFDDLRSAIVQNNIEQTDDDITTLAEALAAAVSDDDKKAAQQELVNRIKLSDVKYDELLQKSLEGMSKYLGIKKRWVSTWKQKARKAGISPTRSWASFVTCAGYVIVPLSISAAIASYSTTGNIVWQSPRGVAIGLGVIYSVVVLVGILLKAAEDYEPT